MNEKQARELGAAHGLFAGAPPLVLASAPGRLDVMGGIADYSGSLVLELPLPLRAYAAVGDRGDRMVRAVSLPEASSTPTRSITVDLDQWFAASDSGYQACRSVLADASTADARAGSANPIDRLASAEADREALLTSIERSVARTVAEKYGIGDLELRLDRQSGQWHCNYEIDLQEQGRILARAVRQAIMARLQPPTWPGYVLGSVPVLYRERGIRPRSGFDLLLVSEVPEGKGVASSAAVEVASAGAILGMLGVNLSPRELALLCQQVENDVVGAACGVMDQMTAACGKAGSLLRLRCQPAEVEAHVLVPPGFQFLGVDSGVRHAVAGADYTSVRTAAFMGWRILADLEGLDVQPLPDGRVDFVHPRWGRYLANVTPAEWAQREARVPERMPGADFLARYGATSDPATRVDLDRTYSVRQATAHPIHEHARVREFAELLPRAGEPGVVERLGELMYASHASYSACGLGSEATDAIVAAARAAGPAAGVFGAKITGGGSGGTVAVLARADADVARIFAGWPLIRGVP